MKWWDELFVSPIYEQPLHWSKLDKVPIGKTIYFTPTAYAGLDIKFISLAYTKGIKLKVVKCDE